MQKVNLKKIKDSLFFEELWVSISDFDEDCEDLEDNELECLKRSVRLNILTKSILEYDSNYFSNKLDFGNVPYRLISYSYVIYLDYQQDSEDAYKKLIKMGKNWFKASFSKTNFSSTKEYHGEIEIADGPVKYRKHRIYISDETLDEETLNKINETYEFKEADQDEYIITRITDLLTDVEFEIARVYKVGNANLINLFGCKYGRRFNLVYDVGCSLKRKPSDKRRKYNGALASFRSVIPNVVFLSHWDDDHFKGCGYANPKIFECPWFAPEIVKTNAINARRLASYLNCKDNLYIIKRSDKARKLIGFYTLHSKLSFYLGENKNKDGITKENCGGLVMEIQHNKEYKQIESLFCGDVPYRAIETEIWNGKKIGYDNLIVPHHGSKMDCSLLKFKNKGKAVVCGNNNGIRPTKDHETALKTGYNVLITEEALPNSWIDLEI